jgi:hypothetical protein
MPAMRLAETMAEASDAADFAATHGSAGARMAGDWLSIGIVVATLASMLPPIAAALAIIYHLIRLWETATVRGWRARLRDWWRTR